MQPRMSEQANSEEWRAEVRRGRGLGTYLVERARAVHGEIAPHAWRRVEVETLDGPRRRFEALQQPANQRQSSHAAGQGEKRRGGEKKKKREASVGSASGCKDLVWVLSGDAAGDDVSVSRPRCGVVEIDCRLALGVLTVKASDLRDSVKGNAHGDLQLARRQVHLRDATHDTHTLSPRDTFPRVGGESRWCAPE
jgi:hypothetical protein